MGAPGRRISLNRREPAAVTVARDLREAVERLRFRPPVARVYNPLRYAWEPHRLYLERFAAGRRDVLLVGMNPGPWGMAQTGVPFGDVKLVRDWIGIEASVARPVDEHPKRPVLGFDCPRREVSGSRLWGWARDGWGTPERFFRSFFVHNYCPLAFLEPGGRNRTPDKLPAVERASLFAACDVALVALTRLLRPRRVVGVGRFAATRAQIALEGADVVVGSMPHPSPASPQANRGWAEQASRALRELDIELP